MPDAPAVTDSTRVDTDAKSAGSEDELRAATYSILGTLLATPPRDSLLALLTTCGAENDNETLLTAAWRMLAAAARRASPATVADEYQTLFIGLGRGELVPFGSWYLTGYLMEQPLAQLRRDLARLGFERQEGVTEPEDHAAALCETMALMGAGDQRCTLEQQGAFFDAHLRPWMARFFRDMQKAASARFYRAVGQLGEQFIDVETRYLDMVGRPPAPAARAADPGMV